VLRALVGMTGPVIRGRAGRTPLPLMHPPPLNRFPYAAPCEICISLFNQSSEPPGL